MISNEEKLVQTLSEMGLSISTAESCTGGMIASAIIDVAGASDVFNEGFITYANEAKIKYLSVKEETIDKYGVVSEETVTEMAKGCKENTGSDVAVVSSGIAGPGGGTVNKPVGLVYLACAYKDVVVAKKFVFDGNRKEIRTQATAAAIQLVLDTLESQ